MKRKKRNKERKRKIGDGRVGEMEKMRMNGGTEGGKEGRKKGRKEERKEGRKEGRN